MNQISSGSTSHNSFFAFFFCRHIIKTTALHGRFLPQCMSHSQREVCTTFSWTKKLTDENTSLTLTMGNSCSLCFWYREAEWQSGRVVRVLDLKFRGPAVQCPLYRWIDKFLNSPEFNPSDTAINSQLVCLRPVGILIIFFILLASELVFEP